MKTKIQKKGKDFIIEFSGNLGVFGDLDFTKKELLDLRNRIDKIILQEEKPLSQIYAVKKKFPPSNLQIKYSK